MDVYPQGISSAAAHLSGAALTIGNFDGVHLGHQRLLSTAAALAREEGGLATVLTFWPHPAQVLAPHLAPPQLTTRGRRRELLEAAGAQALIEQPFGREFAALPREAFTEMLFRQLKARAVVVGWDFTYGKGRSGDIESLKKAAGEAGARLEIVEPVSVGGLVVSSSKVREFLLAGKVEAAASFLGRPFDIEGLVVRGAGRGRKIGVPTANLAPPTTLVPALGVYATRVHLPDGTQAAGACNVGLNPTFRTEEGPNAPVSVEVHLLDRDQDLYGQTLRVDFVDRLRSERRFGSVEALVAQLKEDIAATRRILG